MSVAGHVSKVVPSPESPEPIGDRYMKRYFRFDRLPVAGIIAAAVAWPLTQVAQAGPPEPAVAPAIQVADGNAKTSRTVTEVPSTADYYFRKAKP